MLTVYLTGSLSSDRCIQCPLKSMLVVLLRNYCATQKCKFIFIRSQKVKNFVEIKPSCITDCDVEYIESESMPNVIAQCERPSILSQDGKLVHCGLCSVLRLIVKVTPGYSEGRLHSKLLGHKDICLKACAEVSVWTKFCEVEFPSTVEKVLSESIPPASIPIPADLIKLENHLGEPPIVANINKKRREAQENKVNVDAVSVDLQKSLSLYDDKGKTGEVQLDHLFAEGTDFTLTDLVLFPCMSSLLNHWNIAWSTLVPYIPRVMLWYKRVSSQPGVSQAMAACGLTVYNTTTQASKNVECCLTNPESIHLGTLNIRECAKKKFKAKQSDLDNGLSKVEKSDISFCSTEHPCKQSCSIRLPWEQLPAAVHPTEGELPLVRVERKCQQLENLATAIQGIAKPGDVIVDFCSGGGHLGLLVAYLLPSCKVILVENKEESIQRAVARVDKLGLTNVVVYQSNLDYFHGQFTIGTCLHACGVATDLVLQRCLDKRASFVICPCCYGAIQNTHTMSYPRSGLYKKTGITYDEYRSICHSADRPNKESSGKSLGKLCMEVIDTDRALVAMEMNYDVTLCTLDPPSCSPKNDLLIGIMKNVNT